MAEQKIELCPFCGSECETAQGSIAATKTWRYVYCTEPMCRYISRWKPTEAEAIAAHNKVSRNNAAADDLLKVLQSVEWPDKLFRHCACPYCRMQRKYGHTEDCKLAAAIAKATGEPA